MGEVRTAKVFWNGRSQAVRLPKEFRMPGREVLVHREGNKIVLEPLPEDEWGEAFWEVFGQLGADFDVGDRGVGQDRDLGL